MPSYTNALAIPFPVTATVRKIASSEVACKLADLGFSVSQGGSYAATVIDRPGW
jgi:hypothetical protein